MEQICSASNTLSDDLLGCMISRADLPMGVSNVHQGVIRHCPQTSHSISSDSSMRCNLASSAGKNRLGCNWTVWAVNWTVEIRLPHHCRYHLFAFSEAGSISQEKAENGPIVSAFYQFTNYCHNLQFRVSPLLYFCSAARAQYYTDVRADGQLCYRIGRPEHFTGRPAYTAPHVPTRHRHRGFQFCLAGIVILIINGRCNVWYPAQIAGLIWIQIVLPRPSLL